MGHDIHIKSYKRNEAEGATLSGKHDCGSSVARTKEHSTNEMYVCMYICSSMYSSMYVVCMYYY